MPIYDFKCDNCGYTGERICSYEESQKQVCTCKSPLRKVPSLGRYIPFKEGWYENIAKDPIYITSKRQLRTECDKHDVGSVYLDDS